MICRHHVHLFVQVLSDICYVKEPGRCVERVAPRVPQTLRPDLTSMIGLTDERVVGGDGVRIAVIDVESQQRSKQRVEILAVEERVATASAVAESGVEHSVGAARKQPSIVVRLAVVRCGRECLKGRAYDGAGAGGAPRVPAG